MIKSFFQNVLLVTFVFMGYQLNKKDRLKSKKLIEELFTDGKSISVYPMRLIHLEKEHCGNHFVQSAFSVSKRKFKLAVHRNRIKRLMREAYRTNHETILQDIDKKHIIMITYIDENVPIYVELEEKMILLLIKFMEKVKE